MPMVNTCSFSFIGGRAAIPSTVRDQFFPGRLKTADHHFAQAFCAVRAQGKIVVRCCRNKRPEHKRACSVRWHAHQGPEVGREKPGPTERFPAEIVSMDDRFPSSFFPSRTTPRFQSGKSRWRFAFGQDDLAGPRIQSALRREREARSDADSSLPERVSRQLLFDVGVTNGMRFALSLSASLSASRHT